MEGICVGFKARFLCVGVYVRVSCDTGVLPAHTEAF